MTGQGWENAEFRVEKQYRDLTGSRAHGLVSESIGIDGGLALRHGNSPVLVGGAVGTN